MMKITDCLYWGGIGGALALSAFLFLREHKDAKRVQKTQTIEQKIQEVNYNAEDFTKDSPQILLARVLYGEARSESRAAKEAIASTILNRTKKHVWWGESNYSNIPNYSLSAVILKPFQYSCFNSNDPNLAQLKHPRGDAWKECLAVSKEVLDGKVKDSTSGSTHYHNAKKNPNWTEGVKPKLILPTSIGGDFKFYKLER
jgi:N-acetylmuramoyl-L-alanine amidase